MIKRFIKMFKKLFDCEYLFGTDNIHSTSTKKDENTQEYDEPMDCTGFYLSNTETNYGKSHFRRDK